MTPRDLTSIRDMALKLLRGFFFSVQPSLASLLSGGTVQPENTYFCILKVPSQVWESQKKISMKTNHS